MPTVGKAKSLSILFTEQQPLGNLHSIPINTTEALRAASETERQRGASGLRDSWRAIQVCENIYFGDVVGNMTLLFTGLALGKPKMSGEGHRRQDKEEFWFSQKLVQHGAG